MFLSRAKQFCRFSLFTHAANYCKRQGASIVVARKIYSAMTSAMVVPSRPTVLQLLPRYQYKSKFCTSSKKKVVFDKSMENHLGNMKRRYEELSQQLATRELDQDQLIKLGREFSELGRLMVLVEEREGKIKAISDLKVLEAEERSKGDDGEEMAMLAQQEREELEIDLVRVENEIISFLTPCDDHDDRNIVLEVRAGTGGDEASLFAGEVFRMYQRYAQVMGWKWEEMSLTKTEIGGFKEAQAQINGENVYRHMKFESGVHRVQRVPVNDTKIQTSAASVIVMPEAEDVDVEIRPQDLKIDVFRSGGAGGQSVNKTESAVRMTHIPTGIVIVMQDERSQIQNRARALKYLRARVYDHERSKAMAARQELRSAAQGTGDRSDKIRTYNFPQDRVTDHRAGVTVTGVSRVLSGEFLNDMVHALIELDENERTSNFIQKLTNGNKDE